MASLRSQDRVANGKGLGNETSDGRKQYSEITRRRRFDASVDETGAPIIRFGDRF